jgi:hypothetical protein
MAAGPQGAAGPREGQSPPERTIMERLSSPPFGLATRTAGVTEGVMASESPVPLPEQPSLEQLRNQAKDLRQTSGIPLWEAQLSVARRYGFTSWARLKQYVELLTRYSRFPAGGFAH